MDALLSSEYERLLGLVGTVLDDVSQEPPWGLVVTEFRQVVPAAYGMLAEIRWRQRTARVDGWTPKRLGNRPLASLLTDSLRGHPLAGHYARTDDRSPRISNAGRQLVVPLSSPHGVFRCVVLGRPGQKRFTRQDLTIARHAQPVLTSVDTYLRRRHPDLTARETQVLTLLADGLTGQAMAPRLGISRHTVNRHLEHLYRKLNTTNRLDAVLRAQSLGLLPAART
jgi:DNA-binding CsgD family transcriptional regulator